MKTLNEHLWVVEFMDEEGTYWPEMFDTSRKKARELSKAAKWVGEITRVRKYVPESKDW